MQDLQLPKKQRKFLPANLACNTWESVESFFEALNSSKLNTEEEASNWLSKVDELECAIEEESAWRYIRMTCNASDEKYLQAYETFVQEVLPKAHQAFHDLHLKLVDNKTLFPQTAEFQLFLRNIEQSIKLFREENLMLDAELKKLGSDYSSIIGALSIELEGEELTLQQASKIFLDPNREKRQKVYELVQDARFVVAPKLDEIFNKMVGIRHQIALNADFKNYRDYRLAELGRFDYSAEDCIQFHEAVAQNIVPLIDKFHKKRQKELGLPWLRPWDLQVDTTGLPALKPFENGDDLLEKGLKVFDKLKPQFAHFLRIMKENGHFDLVSRKGKAPGGYNYPLPESGAPFIFMNATGTLRDLTTFVHEGGHAVHSFLANDLKMNAFKNPPMEMAEVASMAMELITLDDWDIFFEDENDLKRAKIEHLEDVITMLPWIALIDAFQHWIYLNPTHSTEERHTKWIELSKKFSSSVVDYSGYEKFQSIRWHAQLHLFEVPFYYIEYAIAQLASIGIWKNFMENKEKSLEQYSHALSLGYTVSLPELYQAAGIEFSFSSEHLQSLIQFVQSELNKLN